MYVFAAVSGDRTAIGGPGWFTVDELSQWHPLSAAAQGAQLLVLSDAAHRAMLSAPLGTPGLDGVFTFDGGVSRARVSVSAGPVPGTALITIDTRDSTGDEPADVRLVARVRTSWLQGVVAGAADHARQSARLIRAIALVAAVPRQQTVTVTVSGSPLAPGAPLPASFDRFVGSLAGMCRQETPSPALAWNPPGPTG